MSKTIDNENDQLEQDWEFHKGLPSTPDRFDSFFVNEYGERWWCRQERDKNDVSRFLVWGDDVDEVAVTKLGNQPRTFPWIMDEAEKLWLLANLKFIRTPAQGSIPPTPSTAKKVARPRPGNSKRTHGHSQDFIQTIIANIPSSVADKLQKRAHAEEKSTIEVAKALLLRALEEDEVWTTGADGLPLYTGLLNETDHDHRTVREERLDLLMRGFGEDPR